MNRPRTKRLLVLAALAVFIGLFIGCADTPPPECGPLTFAETCQSW